MEYIYQIDLDKFRYAKKEFRKSAADLDNIKENIEKEIADTCENTYIGADSRFLNISLKCFLNNDYTEMRERIEKIGEILSDGLNEGRTCKDYCQHFISILRGEFPGIIEGGENIRGKLFCDMEKIETTSTGCQDVADSKELIDKGMDDIDETLSGLRKVSFDYQTQTGNVRNACKQLERLETYSTALSTYAQNVESLDLTLKTKFDECYDENTVPNDIYWKRKYADVEEKLDIFISLIEKPNETLTAREREEIQKLTERLVESGNVEAMKTIVQKINEKNVEDWGNEDAQISAAVWKYGFEQEKTEVLEVMLNEMAEVSYGPVTIVRENGRAFETVPCTACISAEKVEAILNCLDSTENGEAYFSLSRWGKFAAQKVCVKRGETVCGGDEMPQFLVEKGKDGIQVTITYGKTEKTLGTVDMNKVFGESGERTLRGLGFSEKDILNLKCSVYEDEDIVFMEKLAKANSVEAYADVFQENPDNLSIYTQRGLYLYAHLLWKGGIPYDVDTAMVQVSEIDMTNYTTFMNGLLYCMSPEDVAGSYQDSKFGLTWTEDYREKYLAILSAVGENVLSCQREQIRCSYKDTEMLKQQLPLYQMSANETVLYETILSVMEDDVYFYDKMRGHMEVQNWLNLANCEETQFLYDLDLCIKYDGMCNGNKVIGGKYREGEPLHVRVRCDSGNAISTAKNRSRLIDAERERQWAVPNAILDTAWLAATIIQPESALLGTAISGVSTVKDSAGIVNGVLEAERYEEKCRNDLELVYFGDLIRNGEKTITEGIYSAETLLKTIRFEEEGYSFLAEDIESIESKILDTDGKSWMEGENVDTKKYISEEEAMKRVEELYKFGTGKNIDGTKADIHDIDINKYENYIDFFAQNAQIPKCAFEQYNALKDIYSSVE